MRESDRQLVLRARVDDHAAYGQLVARHQGRVRGWLRHLCGDHAEADDLAQNAFVRAWTRIGDLKDAARFVPWLMKIAYYEFLQSRRASGRRERFMERLANEQEPVQQDQTDAARDAALDLRRTLAILSRRERAVVILELCLWLFARRGKRIDRIAAGHGQVNDPPRQPKGTGAVRCARLTTNKR